MNFSKYIIYVINKYSSRTISKTDEYFIKKICFESALEEEPLKYNRSYIINLEDEFDKNGEPNDGSHYTCFQVNKYPNGKVEPIYFDSFGVVHLKEVLNL